MVTLDQAGWGRTALVIIPPPAELDDFVEFLWVDPREHSAARSSQWRIVPDDAPHIIYARFVERGGRGEGHRLSVIGARRTYEDIDCSNRLLTAGARLKPGAVPALFRLSAKELTDRSTSAESLVGSLARAALASLEDDPFTHAAGRIATFVSALRRRGRMTSRTLLLVILSSVATAPALAQAPVTASADTRLFAMQSNFWVNLHHFLYVTSRAQRGLDATRTAVTNALADTAGFGALSREARDGWQAALNYYTASIADRDVVFDSTLGVAAASLSRLTTGQTPKALADVDSAMARALELAAPAYRAAWWPRHDASNRAWIAAVRPLLQQHGDSAAAWEARAFGITWPSEPVRVDVTAYSNWAGAYTTANPDRVTMASLNDDTKGTAAFETLFHEVLHTMDRPLFERFREAARAQGKRMPRNPTHPFIFYTAGEVSRRLLRNHVPYAEETGLWARSRDWAPMRALLQKHWQPWLDGTITLDEALRRIVNEL